MTSIDLDLTIPVVVWGKTPPKHPISCTYVTNNGQNIVTGCSNGLICKWDILDGKITPKYLFMGHKSTVTCMINVGDSSMISCSEDGAMTMWDIADGYCNNVMKLQYAHTKMEIFRKKETREKILFCCGYYSDILVLNPYTLEVIFKLQSLVNSNWISCFHVQKSGNQNIDIVLGLTVNGTIKLWMLKNNDNEENCLEVESKKLNCENAVSLRYNTACNLILVVCLNYWEIYDTNFFTCVSMTEVSTHGLLQGGDFFSSNVIIIWNNCGTCYFYNLDIQEKSQVSVRLFHELRPFSDQDLCVNSFKILSDNKKMITSGGNYGNICYFDLTNFDKSTKQVIIDKSSLTEYWLTSNCNNFKFGKIESEPNVSMFIWKLNQIVLGLCDGTIIVVPAVNLILKNVFNIVKDSSNLKILSSHKGRVNALLYPHQIYSSYDKVYLVSGGSDFSVCLWNIFTGVLLHKFCVHSGEITQLIVPPNNCKPRIQKCICSVANDHSVSILSLTERKCVILASNHMFPIFSINWRPLDDFIIIECYDGSVYVWEMETGSLDRVLTGVLAQEVLDACQELDIINDQYSNPVVHFLRGVKSRNVTEIFHAAQRGLFHLQHFVLNDRNHQPTKKTFPLLIDDLRYNDGSVLGQVLYLNLESIISELYLTSNGKACEELNRLTQLLNVKNLTQGGFDLSKVVAHTIEKVKNETENIQSRFQPKPENKNKKDLKLKISDKNPVESFNFIKTLAQVVLSLLHCWGLNKTNDEICLNNGLLKPCFLGSFGILSYKNNLSVNIPIVDKNDSSLKNVPALNISPVLVSYHLSSVNSLVNTLKNINMKFSETECNWMCLMENNKFLLDSECIKRPKIEVLTLMYQNNCLEIRQVVQELLLNELNVLGREQRLKLVKFWYPYLPTSKTLITGQDKNIDSNIVVFTYNKSELQMLSLVVLSVIRINFAINNYKSEEQTFLTNVSNNTSQVLEFILFNLPIRMAYSKLRRVATDLIGKGFSLWSKHLPHNKTILTLLEMCEDIDKHLPMSNPIVTSVFDLAYTAHKSLLNIARNDTKIFLNVLLEEINNYRVHPNPNMSLDKSKSEIIFILHDLMLSKRNAVSEFLVYIIDILMFCIDSSLLKSKLINTMLPNLNSYHQLHHSLDLNKIAIGLNNGSLAIYEVKNLKYNILTNAHDKRVNCVQFSPDGKTLCSFSFLDNTVCFWQVSTTMFGFGNAHIKKIKSLTDPSSKGDGNDHGKLMWLDNKNVKLYFETGCETLFQI